MTITLILFALSIFLGIFVGFFFGRASQLSESEPLINFKGILPRSPRAKITSPLQKQKADQAIKEMTNDDL